ncbi:MAG: cytochrome c biogenesis protein CcsA [Planctomycetota bacterium]
MTATVSLILAFVAAGSQCGVQDAPPPQSLPQSLDIAAIRAVPVQHNGRWPPLDTLARETVESVTGNAFHDGHDPVLLLLAWTADPETWQRRPLIEIANAGLRRELRLSPTRIVFSYEELAGHAPLHDIIQNSSSRPPGRKPDALESKAGEIYDKLAQLQAVFQDRAICLIPDPNDIGGAWRPIPATPDDGADGERGEGVRVAWASLKVAFLADDGPRFARACEELKDRLNALPAAHRPSPELIATELRYNQWRPFRIAWGVMVAGAVLAGAAMFIRRRLCDIMAVLGMVAGFAILTYGLSMRWQIAGRIPASNMFESLLFLSWGMGFFAILSMFVLRNRVVPLTASVMGATALILADCLPMDPYIRPIAPVLLDTYWMSIHVPIIMVSYSVLALGVLVAHGQLLVMAIAPRRRDVAKAVDTLHYWYIHTGSILLFAGIVTGSMWAADSWGRYWGWDPKEVWSLAAFLGYLTILHVRLDRERVPTWALLIGAALTAGTFAMIIPQLGASPARLLCLAAAAVAMAFLVLARGHFATAVKSVLAFWLIVMTYVGVNYVLNSGLHSYGFGTGAVARNMLFAGGLDLAFVAVCGAIHLLRQSAIQAEAPQQA